MGTTAYEIAFTAQDYMRVRIVSERGRGVVSFTVQYEAVIDGVTYPVVRYDTAHSIAHRDVSDAAGRNVDQLWLNWPYADALDHAIADLQANWRDYRADFTRRISRD